MKNLPLSPISRHPTMSRLHWLAYAIHDTSSVAFLIALLAHEQVIAPILLLVSVLSGIWLIGYRKRKGISKGHLTQTAVVTGIIVNQGMAVAMLGWLLYFPGTLRNNVIAFLSLGICLHAVWSLARSFRLIYLPEKEGTQFSESTIQLIYMIAAPNFVIFLLLAAGLWPHSDSGLVTGLLVFECISGVAFSLAHDQTWVWGQQGIARWQREAICLTPYAVLTYTLLAVSRY